MANTNAALTNPSVIINNANMPIVPNTLSFTEGGGEQAMRVQSGGGGSIDVVYSQNVESRLATVSFSVLPTSVNIEALRAMKFAGNANAIQIVDPESGLQRSFLKAALTTDYQVNAGADAVIEVEFKSLPPI